VVRALQALVLLLAATNAASYAQDDHTSTDPGASLYSASPFAHGFRHGYEEGYHDADRMLQLATFELSDLQIQKIPKPSGGPDGADRARFKAGFEAGYKRGFEDSAANQPFRLPSRHLNALVSTGRDFDSGVYQGASGAPGCPQTAAHAFCSGILVGKWLSSNSSAETEVASAVSDSRR
jgi:hypothetical protein